MKTTIVKTNNNTTQELKKVPGETMDKECAALNAAIAKLGKLDVQFTGKVTVAVEATIRHFIKWGDNRPYNALIDTINPATAGRVWRFTKRYLGRMAEFDKLGHIVNPKALTNKVREGVVNGINAALADGVNAFNMPSNAKGGKDGESVKRSMTQAALEKALSKLLTKAADNELDAFAALRNVLLNTDVDMAGAADALAELAENIRPVHAA